MVALVNSEMCCTPRWAASSCSSILMERTTVGQYLAVPYLLQIGQELCQWWQIGLGDVDGVRLVHGLSRPETVVCQCPWARTSGMLSMRFSQNVQKALTSVQRLRMHCQRFIVGQQAHAQRACVCVVWPLQWLRVCRAESPVAPRQQRVPPRPGDQCYRGV